MKLLASGVVMSLALLTGYAFAQQGQQIQESHEEPDALVMRISQEVLNTAKMDRQLQKGDPQKVQELVEQKILPSVNFEHMTAMAAGRHWRDATPEQQKQLTDEFRALLVRTYSGALAQVKDQRLEYKPFHMIPTDLDVEVKSVVLQPRGEPIQVNYRLERTAVGWKIYDVNIMGVWLIETYKGNFSSEIEKGGIDGLIKTLVDKNRRLSSTAHS